MTRTLRNWEKTLENNSFRGAAGKLILMDWREQIGEIITALENIKYREAHRSYPLPLAAIESYIETLKKGIT
jgi:hypothetical protein